MATNYPSSLDSSTQQPTIAASDEMDDSGKEHDVVHTNHSGAIIALETKLGTGDSNAVADAVLMGTGSGTSGWDTSPTFKGAVTVGVDDTGHDVKFFGATASSYLEWDESLDSLILNNSGQVIKQDNGIPSLSFESFNDTEGNSGRISFYKADNTQASPQAVDDNASLGQFRFYGYDGNSYAYGAFINVLVDGTPGDGDMPTEMQFGVTPDGSETPATAVTISPSGNMTLSSGALFATAKIGTGVSSFTVEPWNASTIALGTYGSIGTQGSYRTTMAWNFERGTGTTWDHLDINSYPQAGAVEIGNTGIIFRWQADFETDHADLPTDVLIMDADALYPADDAVTDLGTSAKNFQLGYINYVYATGGSASYPAYVFQGDGNTGMYSSGADKITFSTGGSIVAEFADSWLALRLYGQGAAAGPSIYFQGSGGEDIARIGPPNNDDIHVYGLHASSYCYMGSGDDYKFYFSNANATGWYPYEDNIQDLGWSGRRFDDIYATNSTINTSDISLKKDIADTTLGLEFIKALRPVEYKWKDGTRKHQGFIAQEVEIVLNDKAVAAEQGMWGVNTIKEGEKVTVPVTQTDEVTGEKMPVKTEVDNVAQQMLRYSEFIAPIVKAIQELEARVASLEG